MTSQNIESMTLPELLALVVDTGTDAETRFEVESMLVRLAEAEHSQCDPSQSE